MKSSSPLQKLLRFKNEKSISMTIDGQVVWMTFDHVRELQKYLSEMLDGDLVIVQQKQCGCLEKLY